MSNPSEQQSEARCCEILPDLPVSLAVLSRVLYAAFTVLLCVFRVCEVQQELSIMAVCLMFGWCNVMFFARGFERLGPFVIMIQKVGEDQELSRCLCDEFVLVSSWFRVSLFPR